MSEVDGTIDPLEELEDQMREHSETAVALLDGARPVIRQVGKEISFSGVPPEFQRRATALLCDLEELESDLSTYVIGVEK